MERINEASPLISVIVPVYNTEKELPRCIESVLAQTYGHLELLLVDDGSEDGSGAICDSYAEKDPRIRVFHQDRAGVSEARNRALDSMRGEYAAFVDSDDYAEPGMLEILLNECIAADADMSVCGWYSESDGNETVSHLPIPEKSILTPVEAFCQVLRNGGMGGYLWNKLFRTELLDAEDRRLRFDGGIRICQDIPFVCEAVKGCRRCAYVPRELYHYYERSGSAVRSWDERRATQMLAYGKIMETAADMDATCRSAAREQYVSMALYLTAGFRTRGKRAEAKQTRAMAGTYLREVMTDRLVSRRAKIKYAAMYLFPAASTSLWGALKRRFGLTWTWPAAD